MLWDPLGRGVADTTVALTAIALATSRIRFGPLVTPVGDPAPARVWARTDGPDDERALAYPKVGATWWVEAFDPRRDALDDVRRRIDAGPPRTS